MPHFLTAWRIGGNVSATRTNHAQDYQPYQERRDSGPRTAEPEINSRHAKGALVKPPARRRWIRSP